jgi:phage nucleotide-binding protein
VTIETLTPKYIAGLPIVKATSRTPYMNILIYGDSGVGKTRLAGSADAVPSMRKVLLVDVEGGSLTLEHTYPDIDLVRVKTWDQVQGVYDSLYAGGHGYNTVILDSLTEIQKFNMDQVMLAMLENDGKTDPDVPSLREWGKNLNQMRKFVRAFRDLEMHTIFTALGQQQKTRLGSMVKKPYLSGKLADEVAAFLDIVVYMYKKQIGDDNLRLLLTEATDDVTAKDRTNKLPTVLQDPTMADILKYIGKNETEN